MTFRPIAQVSQVYDWEGDPAVEECLVFFSLDQIQKFEKDHDVKLATFWMRSVLQGDGTYHGLVRLGATSEVVYEIPIPTKGQHTTMVLLTDLFLGGFDLKPADLSWVPNTKLD